MVKDFVPHEIKKNPDTNNYYIPNTPPHPRQIIAEVWSQISDQKEVSPKSREMGISQATFFA